MLLEGMKQGNFLTPSWGPNFPDLPQKISIFSPKKAKTFRGEIHDLTPPQRRTQPNYWGERVRKKFSKISVFRTLYGVLMDIYAIS